MEKIKFALQLANDCTYADEMTEGAKQYLRNAITEAIDEALLLAGVSGKRHECPKCGIGAYEVLSKHCTLPDCPKHAAFASGDMDTVAEALAMNRCNGCGYGTTNDSCVCDSCSNSAEAPSGGQP